MGVNEKSALGIGWISQLLFGAKKEDKDAFEVCFLTYFGA